MLRYGEIIRKTLESEGWTTTKLADKVGVSRSHLTGILIGFSLPSWPLHQKICDALALDENFYAVSSDVDASQKLTFKATKTCRSKKWQKE